MEKELLEQLLGIEGTDEAEEMMEGLQAFLAMLGGGAEQRVVLTFGDDVIEGYTHDTILNTVRGLHRMREEILNKEEILSNIESERADGKTPLTEEEVGLIQLVTAYEIGKQFANDFIASLAEDENPVVKGISTENYDECTCSVCSITHQLEELGLLEEDE